MDQPLKSGAVGQSIQGASVALSSDGNTAVVGGYGDNSYIGAAWVYTRSGGVWTQQGSKLVGTGAVGAAGQGSSVALSSGGNTAVVGGNGDNTGIGRKVRLTAPPPGSRFKGYTSFVVQDLVLGSHVIDFQCERWQAPQGGASRILCGHAAA